MVFLQTLGSVDAPGSGMRKMPAPRAYVSILIVWEVLNLIAAGGRERAASVMGWVMVLTGIFVGPFGKKLVSFFNHIADTYGAPAPPNG